MTDLPLLKEFVDYAITRGTMTLAGKLGEQFKPPEPLLAKYRFTNNNVQDDRGSRAIFDLVTCPYAKEPHLIVALAVCRFTNSPEVIEAIRSCLAPFDAERFVAIMRERAARGLPLEHRAYTIPGGERGELKAASLTRDLFIPLADAAEQIRPRPADTCQVVFERLQHFKHLGKGFLTAQIVRDLKQTEPLRAAPDWRTFVVSGPGSQRGVNRICGATTETEIARVRPEAQWRRLFLEIVAAAEPQLAEAGVEVDDLQSYQNICCEFDKLMRFRSGDLRGARLYVPYGEKSAPTRRKSKPASAPAPIETPTPTATPAPHALPELAGKRDPDAPHILHHDVETRSAADLTAVGAHRYAADPTTEVLCLAYAVNDERVRLWVPHEPVPAEFIEAANNPNWLVVAHNDQFERLITQYILGPQHGFPMVPIGRRRCSMAATLAAALPASLEKAVEALGLPHEKDKAGQALMRRMAKPLPGGAWIEDTASREQLHAYCRADVEAERALYRALPPLTADEQALWELDAEINERGFHVDRALLEAARDVVIEAEVRLQEEFAAITGLDSTNQRDKLVAWLGEHGCEVEDAQKGTLAHALRRKDLAPEVRRAIELRRQLAHASANKIKALLAWRGGDDRVRGTFRFHGAGTGRWTGYGVQPQNFKRDAEGTEAKVAAVMHGEVLASPVEAVGDIARSMICAAPGRRFLIADFSGIESRVTAWVSEQESKLAQWRAFDASGALQDDPYFLLGRACGQPEETARATGKTADLAFGYMGGPKAWERLAPESDASDESTIRRSARMARGASAHGRFLARHRPRFGRSGAQARHRLHVQAVQARQR
jgi:DNA polymerase